MSEHLKACFDSPEPSDDLRQRVRALSTRPKGHKPPMQLKIFTSVATAVVLCGFWVTRNRPTVRQEATPAPRHEMPHLLANTVGERMFRIYDYGWNAYGEVYLLYTAGKFAEDAWIKDGQGKKVYRDTSVTTQDWLLSAVTASSHMRTPAEGNIHSQMILHLPIYFPNDLAPGQVPPQRIAPDGFKYEAAVLRFSRKPLSEKPECFLMFTAPPKNYHTPELSSIVLKMQRKGISRDNWPRVGLRLGAWTGTLSGKERIPAAWEKYGVDVAEATRQLEESDRSR